MVDKRISELSETTSGPAGEDFFEFIRSLGGSPEAFQNYKAPISDLISLLGGGSGGSGGGSVERSWAKLVSDNATDSIPNNTNTTIDYAGTPTSGGTKDFLTGAPTNGFIIPAGVTKVRITAEDIYSPDSAGERQLRLHEVSGTDTLKQVIQTGGWSAAPTQPRVEWLLDVTAGEEYVLKAFQNSGSSLNIHAALAETPQYFMIEDVTADYA